MLILIEARLFDVEAGIARCIFDPILLALHCVGVVSGSVHAFFVVIFYAAEALWIGLPRLQLAIVVLCLGVVTEQELGHPRFLRQFVQLLLRQVGVDVINDFVPGEASSFGYACLQLGKRDLAIPEINEEGLVDVCEERLNLILVVVPLVVLIEVDAEFP